MKRDGHERRDSGGKKIQIKHMQDNVRGTERQIQITTIPSLQKKQSNKKKPKKKPQTNKTKNIKI